MNSLQGKQILARGTVPDHVGAPLGSGGDSTCGRGADQGGRSAGGSQIPGQREPSRWRADLPPRSGDIPVGSRGHRLCPHALVLTRTHGKSLLKEEGGWKEAHQTVPQAEEPRPRPRRGDMHIPMCYVTELLIQRSDYAKVCASCLTPVGRRWGGKRGFSAEVPQARGMTEAALTCKTKGSLDFLQGFPNREALAHVGDLRSLREV